MANGTAAAPVRLGKTLRVCCIEFRLGRRRDQRPDGLYHRFGRRRWHRLSKLAVRTGRLLGLCWRAVVEIRGAIAETGDRRQHWRRARVWAVEMIVAAVVVGDVVLRG